MKNDSQHQIVNEVKLPGNAVLHRFDNAAGVAYSAIYVGCHEEWSCERTDESRMVSDWVNSHADLNWPTWNDGKPVLIGESAMSLRGPMEVDAITIDGSGWTLTHYMEGNEYVIDQGAYATHPVREHEWCEFWPESEREAIEYYGAATVAANTGRTVDEVWRDAALKHASR